MVYPPEPAGPSQQHELKEAVATTPSEERPPPPPTADSTSAAAPPPAYSPPGGVLVATSLLTLLNNAANLSSSQEHMTPDFASGNNIPRSARARGRWNRGEAGMFVDEREDMGQVGDDANDDDDEDEDNDLFSSDDDPAPSISMRISTAVRVSSNDNLVVIGNMSESAAAVAAAIMGAIRTASSAHMGIPMVDENGAPRPLRIEVDAGIDINGSGNVLGPEPLLREYLAQAHPWRRPIANRSETEQGRRRGILTRKRGRAAPRLGSTSGPRRDVRGGGDGEGAVEDGEGEEDDDGGPPAVRAKRSWSC